MGILFLQREHALNNYTLSVHHVGEDAVLEQVELLESITFALNFGNLDRFGIYDDSVVSSSMEEELRALMFENACVAKLHPPECDTYDKGFMASGLELAIDNWLMTRLATRSTSDQRWRSKYIWWSSSSRAIS